MLKIVGCHESGKTEVEFGEYLPFKFWYQAQSIGPKFYWRTGDLKSTLFEVEIERATGRIISASLLLPGEVRKDFPVLNLFDDLGARGYPIVDTNGWPDDSFNDEPCVLRVFIDSSRLLITLSESVATRRTISADNTTFGLDANGFIVWILISNLPTEKLELIS